MTWHGAIRSSLVLLYLNLTISFNGIQPRRLVVILTDCIKQIPHAGLELYFSQNGLSMSGTICQCPRILAHCCCSCLAFGLRICLVIYICNPMQHKNFPLPPIVGPQNCGPGCCSAPSTPLMEHWKLMSLSNCP